MNFESLSLPFADTLYSAGEAGKIAKSTDRGLNWRLLNSGTLQSLHGISMPVNTSIGFVAGDSGTILRTIDRGVSWPRTVVPTFKNVRSLAFVEFPVRIWACGDSGTVLKKGSGLNWLLQSVPIAFQNVDLKSVCFDLDTGWVVGAKGAIMKTRNGGTNWLPQVSGVTTTLRSVSFLDGLTGYAVGDSGTILKTTNGGAVWTKQLSGTELNLLGVSVIDERSAIVVGDSGLMLSTKTGGNASPYGILSRTSLHFGSVAVGTRKTGTILVQNDGVLPLQVSPVASDNGVFNITPPQATVGPGEVKAFEIIYLPVQTSHDYAIITFFNSSQGGVNSVTVDGIGMPGIPPSGWSVQNANPLLLAPMDIRFVDSMTAIFVGKSGGVMTTSDLFETWSLRYRQGGAMGDLYALQFVDPQHGFAAGAYGTIISTSNGGASWQQQESKTTEGFSSIAYASPTHAVAIGWNYPNLAKGQVVGTTDGGSTWNYLLNLADTIPGGVAFRDANNGFISCTYRLNYPTLHRDHKLLRTTDGGQTWKNQPVSTTGGLGSITFNGANVGIMVAEGAFLRSTDGGESWDTANAGFPTAVTNIRFLDSVRVVIAGVGSIVQSSDAGLTWSTTLTESPSFAFTSVDFGTPQNGMAVGNDGYRWAIFLTTDGGSQWTRKSFTAQSRHLHGVSSPVPNRSYAVGDSGTVLRTSDGGKSWTSLFDGTLYEKTGVPFYGASFPDSTNGFVVGGLGSIIHTTDGGSHWTDQSLNTSTFFRAVTFYNSRIGYAVGDAGLIIYTSDGGTSWLIRWPGVGSNFMSLSVIDSSRVVVAGAAGTMFRTVDAGVHWEQLNAGTSQSIIGLSFTDVSIGVAITDVGDILRTIDGGVHWTSQNSGVAGMRLSAVSFSNPDVGWIVGEAGLIIRTTDGGQNWTSQSGATPYNVNAIAVNSVNSATAVGDFGTVLHTTTGGIISGVERMGREANLPATFRLEQNYPNPFNPATKLSFVIRSSSFVTLKIHDVLGREVATLVNEKKEPGEYVVRWDANELSSGVYFYRLTADHFVETKKMLLMK